MQGKTEEWNGASWVEVADLSTARGRLSMAGTSTAAVASSGQTPSITTATEDWSGSSVTTKVLTD